MSEFSSPVVKIEVNGARGASFAEVARRTDAFGVVPTDNDRAVLDKFADYAITQNPGFQSIIPGPAGPTFVTLATFRAAPSSNRKQALKVPGIPSGDFYFETTSPPYVDDGVDTIKANDTALSVGAWRRQKDDSVLAGARKYGASNTLASNAQPGIQADYDVNGPYASNRGGLGYLPKGRYRLGASIDLKSYSDYKGDGPRASILDQEDAPVSYPAFKWDYAGVLYGFASVSDVGARGFSHGVLITQDTDEVNLRRMHLANMSSAGVQVTGMLQTGIFDEVKIENSNNGIISSSTVCNAMRIMKCDTRNISGEHIKLNGSEGCLIGGHRAEGGGLSTGITFNLSNTRNLAFEDLYAESTHRKIARIVGTSGVVSFSHSHFTGTGAGGAIGPYTWETDGTGGLIFHCCDSIYYPMRVPAHAKLEGTNPGIVPCVFAGKDSNAQSVMTSNDFALLRVTRLNTSSDAANVTQMRATLTLQITYLSAGGSTLATVDREIEIFARAQGNSLSIDAVTRHASDLGIGANATLTGTSTSAGTASAATALLTMQMPGVVPAGALVFKRSMSIVWNQISSLDGNTFAVELQ